MLISLLILFRPNVEFSLGPKVEVLLRPTVEVPLIPTEEVPPGPKVEVIKTSSTITPPPEHRSYTPPMPTSQSPDEFYKPDSEVPYSPVDEIKSITKENKSQSLDLNSVSHNIITDCSSSPPESMDSNLYSLVEDEDKPYDPEQDILSLIPEKKIIKTMHTCKETDLKGSDHLEKHKKILDALTRQVEETDRQVNALKQLIAVPENEVDTQSPNTSSIDINSVAESGMSSFLDLPDNLQEILNTVRLKSGDKVSKSHEKIDVDMRIKDLFGKQLNLDTDDGVPLHKVSKCAESNMTLSSNAYSSQTSTPLPIEGKGKSTTSGPSDPRIKQKTSFQAQSSTPNDIPKASLSNMSASDLILHAQKQFKNEEDKDSIPPLPQETKKFIGNKLSSNWSSDKEPPPPGVEVKELSVPGDKVNSLQTIADISVPSPHMSNFLVQNSSQQVTSTFPQPPNLFLAHLPHGFSVHTPPPNIQHFPPLTAPPSFPPPKLQLLPPKENESPWLMQQHPTFESEVYKHKSNLSQWDESQGPATQRMNPLHHSSEISEYHNEQFYNEGFSNRPWESQLGYTRGHWNPKYPRGNSFESRRGYRNPFKRNQRN